MKTVLLFWLAIITILLAACAVTRTSLPPEQEINLGDGGLISGEPCESPCFLNITPGISNSEGVKRILEKRIGYESCTWDSPNDALGVNCGNFVIYFNKNSIVETVSYGPTTTVTLEEVINKYQEPDSWLIAVMNENTRPYNVWLVLIYHDLRMTIDLDYQISDKRVYSATPSSQVSSVLYFEDAAYHYVSHTPWQGYGEYKSP